nr:hypothetical protein BaRGS_001034 [Batillaria attramentaria]
MGWSSTLKKMKKKLAEAADFHMKVDTQDTMDKSPESPTSPVYRDHTTMFLLQSPWLEFVDFEGAQYEISLFAAEWRKLVSCRPQLRTSSPAHHRNAFQLGKRSAVCLAHARVFSTRAAQQCAVDGAYLDLIPKQYANVAKQVQVVVECRSRVNPLHRCAGPAAIAVRVEEREVNPIIQRKMDENRAEYKQLVIEAVLPPPQNVCIAAVHMENAITLLIKMAQSTSDESRRGVLVDLACTLFFHLTVQTPLLLQFCLDNPSLAGMVSPHFVPNNAPENFVSMYEQLITVLQQQDMHLVFMLLTKFDVWAWLEECQPHSADKKRFLEVLGSALMSCGAEPSSQTKLVFDLQEILGWLGAWFMHQRVTQQDMANFGLYPRWGRYVPYISLLMGLLSRSFVAKVLISMQEHNPIQAMEVVWRQQLDLWRAWLEPISAATTNTGPSATGADNMLQPWTEGDSTVAVTMLKERCAASCFQLIGHIMPKVMWPDVLVYFRTHHDPQSARRLQAALLLVLIQCYGDNNVRELPDVVQLLTTAEMFDWSGVTVEAYRKASFWFLQMCQPQWALAQRSSLPALGFRLMKSAAEFTPAGGQTWTTEMSVKRLTFVHCMTQQLCQVTYLKDADLEAVQTEEESLDLMKEVLALLNNSNPDGDSQGVILRTLQQWLHSSPHSILLTPCIKAASRCLASLRQMALITETCIQVYFIANKQDQDEEQAAASSPTQTPVGLSGWGHILAVFQVPELNLTQYVQEALNSGAYLMLYALLLHKRPLCQNLVDEAHLMEEVLDWTARVTPRFRLAVRTIAAFLSSQVLSETSLRFDPSAPLSELPMAKQTRQALTSLRSSKLYAPLKENVESMCGFVLRTDNTAQNVLDLVKELVQTLYPQCDFLAATFL